MLDQLQEDNVNYSPERPPHILELDERVRDLLTRFRICQRAHRAMLSQLQTHADMLDECAKDLDSLRSHIGTIALAFSRSAKTETTSLMSGQADTLTTLSKKQLKKLASDEAYLVQPIVDSLARTRRKYVRRARTPAKSHRQLYSARGTLRRKNLKTLSVKKARTYNNKHRKS